MYHRDRLSPDLLQQVSKSRPGTRDCIAVHFLTSQVVHTGPEGDSYSQFQPGFKRSSSIRGI